MPANCTAFHRCRAAACSAIADGFNGFAVHLENHDVAMITVSRAPIAALQAYKRRMGWTFTWASSLNSDFNYSSGIKDTIIYCIFILDKVFKSFVLWNRLE
jgi:predicted dithiol-disulfide oxidoreductase (DUF899 family)